MALISVTFQGHSLGLLKLFERLGCPEVYLIRVFFGQLNMWRGKVNFYLSYGLCSQFQRFLQSCNFTQGSTMHMTFFHILLTNLQKSFKKKVNHKIISVITKLYFDAKKDVFSSKHFWRLVHKYEKNFTYIVLLCVVLLLWCNIFASSLNSWSHWENMLKLLITNIKESFP